MDPDELATRRTQYEAEGFDVADADPDPVVQFQSWYDGIVDQLPEPHAFLLATASATGEPAARTVLMRGLDAERLVFYTNYTSAKARHLDANPRAEAVFSWIPVHRQVRIHGTVERVSEDESDAYFATRPRGSQLGAWASPQSSVIENRAALEAAVAEVATQYPDQVPRPPHWGGFALRPEIWEFWQGRPDRVHDRVRYRRDAGGWERARLAP